MVNVKWTPAMEALLSGLLDKEDGGNCKQKLLAGDGDISYRTK